MAEQSMADFFNTNSIAISTAQRDANRQVQQSVDLANFADVLQAGNIFVVPLDPNAAINANTVSSIPFRLPFPARVVGIACYAGNVVTTLTADLHLKRGLDAYASVLDAPEAVLADTLTAFAAPEAGSTAVTGRKDDLIKAVWVAAGSGAVLGARVWVYLVRI